jgi:hypothetical protein
MILANITRAQHYDRGSFPFHISINEDYMSPTYETIY